MREKIRKHYRYIFIGFTSTLISLFYLFLFSISELIEEDDTYYGIFIGVFLIIGGLIVLLICIMYIKIIIMKRHPSINLIRLMRRLMEILIL